MSARVELFSCYPNREEIGLHLVLSPAGGGGGGGPTEQPNKTWIGSG